MLRDTKTSNRLQKLTCLSLVLLELTTQLSKRQDANEAKSCLLQASAMETTNSNKPQTDAAEEHNNNNKIELVEHPSLFVDTKYWSRNTEMGERKNWLDSRKPCNLYEKIVIGGQEDEPMIVSLGEFFGPLEASIREIVLNSNGVLLLESDQEEIDDSFIHYLGQMGDCINHVARAQSDDDADDQESFYFEFKPDPNQFSWFNPANWQSTLINSDELNDLAPQSHQIPCTEDIVVFADRHASIWSLLIGDEKSSTLSFKINFKPAYNYETSFYNLSLSTLRISKLFIGEQMYTQTELEQLVDLYGTSLFDLTSNNTLLDKFGYAQGNNLQLPLLIDESSIQKDSNYDLCLDEAGCICGNERRDIMAAICSFNEPLIYPHDYPCYDPIKAVGYCDKICGSIITLQMDPEKFSERFVTDLINKSMTNNDQFESEYFRHVFLGSRRVDHTRYEITIRLAPDSKQAFETALGKDREIAEWLKARFEEPAKRSFYGITTVTVASSIQWKYDNYVLVFWLSLSIVSILSTIIYTHEEKLLMARSMQLINSLILAKQSSENLIEHQQASSSQLETIQLIETVEIDKLDTADLLDCEQSESLDAGLSS